jgi:hypothetical protein
MPDTTTKPPVFVRGGKRLNFSREDEWETGKLNDEFIGYGKDTSCSASASWEELCAMATLIVNHPAYVTPGPAGDYYPPYIEDEREAPASERTEG